MKHTLDQQFPATTLALLTEITVTESRLEQLKLMKKQMQEQTLLGDKCAIEVTIPESDPRHRPGKSVGTDFTTCLKAAQQQSGRTGTAFAFINFDNLSLSVNPHDIDPKNELRLGYQSVDPCRRPRFLWTNKNRGCVWLVL